MSQWIQGTVAARTDWTEEHFSLRIDCHAPEFKAGQFVRIGLPEGDEVLARPYSCVNPPFQPGIEIYLNRVPNGPLSNQLALLQTGDTLLIGANANGFLTLDEIPDTCRDLWMVATGTGIGPFLSILQTPTPWERFEKINLIYGVRTARQLAYASLLDQLGTAHTNLRHRYCISRENTRGAFHGRVTDALHSGDIEAHCGHKLTPDRSHVLLCGNKGMIGEMNELLAQRGLLKHRRREPGHVSSEKYH